MYLCCAARRQVKMQLSNQPNKTSSLWFNQHENMKHVCVARQSWFSSNKWPEGLRGAAASVISDPGGNGGQTSHSCRSPPLWKETGSFSGHSLFLCWVLLSVLSSLQRGVYVKNRCAYKHLQKRRTSRTAADDETTGINHADRNRNCWDK